MAARNYAGKRYEKIWVCDDATPGTLTQPNAADAVKGTAYTFTGVAPTFVESEERRATPDIAAFIQRKTNPQSFEVECYAKAPATAGDLPSYMNLLKNGYGVEKVVLTVLDYTLGAGKTVTVTINGSATVLTEGVEFAAATSNAVTATNLAAAIHALSGVSAAASSATVEIQRDAGTYRLSTATNLATFVAKTKVVYSELATSAETPTLSLWVSSDNELSGFRNCKVNTVEWSFSGTAEPKVKFSGVVSHEVKAGVTTVAADYTSGGTSLSVTNPRRFMGLGDAASDKIKILVGSEILLVSAVNYSTGVLAVVGAQDGTSAANHLTGVEVAPSVLGADPDSNDTLISLTLGSVTKGGVTPVVISGSVMQDNGYEARMDEAFQAVSTGFRRVNPRRVSGTIVGYQTQALQEWNADVANATVEAMTIVLGSTGTQKITLSLPLVQIIEPPKTGQSGSEFTRSYALVGLASDTGDDNMTCEFA